MPKVRYAVRVAADVETRPAEFRAEVARVLSDPRGWRKYGYEFEEVPAGSSPDVLIRLETDANTRRLCSMTGLSCQREDEGDIVINEKNWLGGSKSSLPLERYHNYVITHETGHFLGLEHQRCPWEECKRRGMAVCPSSVMQQCSRGPGHVAPCVESDWPLDPDWRIDDPRAVVEEEPSMLAQSVGVLILVLLVVALFAVGAVLGVQWRGAQLEIGSPSNKRTGGLKTSPLR